jgi:NTP pyrophosphatase (non-canonical NTP hydrolase)
MSANSKMGWDQLEGAVLRWAEERGIFESSDPKTQCLKCVSEIGELADNIAMGDHDAAMDDLGDVLVTLIILAKLTDLDLMECLTAAYEVIRRREGKMINGVFVKHVV